jgi:hypothetical protein
MLNPASGLKLPKSEAETAKRMKIGQNLPDKNRRIFGLLETASEGTFRGPLERRTVLARDLAGRDAIVTPDVSSA